MYTNLAKIFSSIFHFLLLGPVSYIIISTNFPLDTWPLSFIYPFLIFLFYIFAPIITIRILMKKGKVSDADVTDRNQRHLLNALFLVFIVLFTIITFFVDVPTIYKLNILYSLVLALVFAFVTFWWKISYHLGGVGWFAAVIYHLYGFSLITFGITLPIILLTSWSRIYLKKHTLAQTIAGFSVSVGLYGVLYYLFF